jgi:hypothetical protein
MTVYEFLEQIAHFSKYDKWNVREHNTDLTKDEPINFDDIKLHYEERENVLNALEYSVLMVDMSEGTIYCGR